MAELEDKNHQVHSRTPSWQLILNTFRELWETLDNKTSNLYQLSTEKINFRSGSPVRFLIEKNWCAFVTFHEPFFKDFPIYNNKIS